MSAGTDYPCKIGQSTSNVQKAMQLLNRETDKWWVKRITCWLGLEFLLFFWWSKTWQWCVEAPQLGESSTRKAWKAKFDSQTFSVFRQDTQNLFVADRKCGQAKLFLWIAHGRYCKIKMVSGCQNKNEREKERDCFNMYWNLYMHC